MLVPSLTYVASFQAIGATGAKPIACDVEDKFLSIDIEDASKRLTPNTKAIMVVHYSGVVGNFDAVLEFAHKHNLRVIEDAAHAFGSTYKDKKVGSFGDITCFSFDGIKNITSGEGGCILADDPKLLSRIKDARLLGVEKDTLARYSGKRSWEFDVNHQGWRYHMSNIMAAIGIVQLERFEELSSKRRKLAERYIELLSHDSRVIPVLSDSVNTVPHIFVVRIPSIRDREGLREKLLSSGIETGVHYQLNHTLSLFKSKSSKPLTVVENIYPTLLTLPMHPDLNLNDIDFIVELLLKNLD